MRGSILAEILDHKRREVELARVRAPLPQLIDRLPLVPPPRSLKEALDRPGLQVIAEVKARSPSRGPLREDLDPVRLAATYAQAGAAAISVLTDERYFGGSLEHLWSIRRGLPDSPPLLRKDFIIDPYQVYEARAHGADAVLLICAALDGPSLASLLDLARDLGMEALVEVHNSQEVAMAVAAGASVIGINNRDLHTFRVDLETTARLRPLIPSGVAVVAESGIHTGEDAARMAALGVNAILVGEALVTSPDPAAKLWELIRASQGSSPVGGSS